MRSPEDLDSVLRLRFEVFNLELGEGLASSFATGRDLDPFDEFCHHLMVEDQDAGVVVGTYRMQTSEVARRGIGFYSAGEFDLSRLPQDVVERSVEIGRACIAKAYRNRSVLFLLWRGLAEYLTFQRKRYLFGCCSVTAQDPEVGLRVLEDLKMGDHLHPTFRVDPLPGLECSASAPAPAGSAPLPILFRTYLRYGARICGPPAIDRAFGTIDFLTLLDIEALTPRLRDVYLEGNHA